MQRKAAFDINIKSGFEYFYMTIGLKSGGFMFRQQ